MKKIIFGIIMSYLIPSVSVAQNCDIPIRVVCSPQAEDIPENALELLNSRLIAAISNDGIVASSYGQFILTAKFNHITEDVVAGPPRQFAVHSFLTLYIGEVEGQQIYSSKTFELRGVGTSLQRAIVNSFRPINARNADFEQFVEVGRSKILTYFNNNYATILARANKAAVMKRFDEALYYACSIPECSTGYESASDVVMKIFQSYMDSDSELLFNKAYTAWVSSPNAEGARIASMYLSLVEPSSAVYSKSRQLADEIKNTVRGDYEFDVREKYNDAVSIKKAYIDAARQIGVAYGNGQKETTTNLLWIK